MHPCASENALAHQAYVPRSELEKSTREQAADSGCFRDTTENNKQHEIASSRAVAEEQASDSSREILQGTDSNF